MTLEIAYWIALAAGLAFLVLSLLLGDLFDFLDFDVGGADFAAAPIFFAATAAFGAGGLLGIRAFELGRGPSIGLGVGTGLGMGALTAALFALLQRQESTEGFETAKLIGERGRCVVAIGPGRVGRVRVAFGGMTRALTATSGEEIAVGDEILVRDVIGNTITVSRAGGASEGQDKGGRS